MSKNPKHPKPGKFPAEARELGKSNAAEFAKMRDQNKRPMKGSKITKGSRRRMG